MKHLFTLLLLVTASISSMAYNNRLSISSTDNNAGLQVYVDGRLQNSNQRYSRSIEINDLRSGYHSIKIYKQHYRGNGWGNGRHNRNLKLLYSGNVYIRNGYHTDMVINRFGRVFTDENALHNRNGNDDDDYNDDDDAYNWNRNTFSNEKMVRLKQTMSQESFDDNRLAILKSAVRDQYISTAQVTELVSLFSFEKSKLDAAKYCYTYCSDAENYYLVANSFSYSSSKTELLQYIERNRDAG